MKYLIALFLTTLLFSISGCKKVTNTEDNSNPVDTTTALSSVMIDRSPMGITLGASIDSVAKMLEQKGYWIYCCEFGDDAGNEYWIKKTNGPIEFNGLNWDKIVIRIDQNRKIYNLFFKVKELYQNNTIAKYDIFSKTLIDKYRSILVEGDLNSEYGCKFRDDNTTMDFFILLDKKGDPKSVWLHFTDIKLIHNHSLN